VVARDHQHASYRTSTASVINPSETIPVELSDGRILYNLQSESSPHKRLVSISGDGATGWSEPRFDDDLTDTVCMASIIRLDDAGSVLFAAPDNKDHDMAWGKTVNCDRKRLSAKLSRNDCRTWSVNRVVEEGPAGYSDLSVASDRTIFCLYKRGQVTRMADDKYCMLARFDREWIENGDRIEHEMRY
jgi:sialidase-1